MFFGSALSEFLLQLKGAKPGQLDISDIPAEELGDVLDTMHALFCFKKDQGITVNSAGWFPEKG